MLQLRAVGPGIAVAPQIAPEDAAALADAGFALVVNNRPDGEDAGQPDGAAVRAAVEGAGLRYVEIPVTHAGFSYPQVTAMADALRQADGGVLAYCRSGTRSINLWALARASMGDDPEALIAQAGNAGYDLGHLRPLLDQVRPAA